MSVARPVPVLAALAAAATLGTLAVASPGTPSGNPVPAPVRSCATIQASPVCTWMETRAGTPVEIHATIPLALIADAPADQPMVWPPAEMGSVPLPSEARDAFGLHRLGINWEAHGHPPATFLTPHFDFHFYSIPQGEVDAIDCSDQTKPGSIPAGFALPDIDIPDMGTLVGLCVPKMGMHALPASDLTRSDPFGASPLVGYYGGRPMFVEPMVARALLMARKDFTLTVPAVEHLPAGVRYPRTIHGRFDTARDELRLILTDFPAR